MSQQLSAQHQITYVIGCPGAGKSSLSAKLAHHLNWAHISVGHELRHYARTPGVVDQEIIECVRTGTLVPATKLAGILQHRVKEMANQGFSSFLIDGFPRSIDQIEYMDKTLGTPDQVIHMECPKDIAKTRVLHRNDATRVDDEDLFEKRFEEYRASTAAIDAYFEARDKLKKVDTSFSTEESFALLQALFETQ